MPFYFAYGSNMLRARLQARIGRVEDFGWSTLHHHRHGFEKRGADGTGKGTIAPHPSLRVHGVLYAITDGQLAELHRFEGGYRMIEIDVVQQSSAAELRAVSYTAIRLVGPLTPTEEYLDYYERGMREHGLPEAYIRWVLDLDGDR